MKRNIIEIDENICNGCGACVPNCHEGALRIIDGKARLISDAFCDGLGACLGECPLGAIKVIEREAEAYDEKKTMKEIVKKGINTVRAHLQHMKDHNELEYLRQGIEYLEDNGFEVPEEFQNWDEKKEEEVTPATFQGCPGMAMRDNRNKKKEEVATASKDIKTPSRLQQWPVQLKLLSPNAPFFDNADLVVAADCVPFTYPNFHERFLKDKILVIFCPKLDSDVEEYIDKLAMIFVNKNIKSITSVHMEVPCCGGVNYVIQKAMEKANKFIMVKDYTISLNGEII